MKTICSKCGKQERAGLDKGWKRPSSWCSSCLRDYHEKYRNKNRGKIRSYHRKYMSKARKEWKRGYDKKYRETHRDYLRIKHRDWNRKIRLEALNHYGGSCECCGEVRTEFLGIDHIFGGGQAHRKSLTISIYRWLKKNNWPAGFRVLCHNCNLSLAFYGYCPHKGGGQ